MEIMGVQSTIRASKIELKLTGMKVFGVALGLTLLAFGLGYVFSGVT